MITSKIMRNQELDLASIPLANPLRYAALDNDDLADLETVDAGDGSTLLGMEAVGAVDRSLVAAAVSASAHSAVTILSADDELVEAVQAATFIDEETYAFVWSESSVAFFDRLHACGALTLEGLLLLLEGEDNHLQDRLINEQISRERAERKAAALKHAASAAAIREAARMGIG